jgi:lysophospholipase L1-like esterase
VKPRWWTARRQIVLVDSVLLGGVAALRDELRGWKIQVVGDPAIMLPAMEDRIAARERVPRLVVLGIGYNSIWERRRQNYRTYARKFDAEAKNLLATLRRKGAHQFVWVTLRDARRTVIPSSALWQYDRYAWYFPYVNQRLRRLDRRRSDLVLARWDLVSDRRRLTYDAIHLDPDGAELMARTVEQAVRVEAKRQTRTIPPSPRRLRLTPARREKGERRRERDESSAHGVPRRRVEEVGAADEEAAEHEDLAALGLVDDDIGSLVPHVGGDDRGRAERDEQGSECQVERERSPASGGHHATALPAPLI